MCVRARVIYIVIMAVYTINEKLINEVQLHPREVNSAGEELYLGQ